MISEKPIDRERLLATVEKGRRAKWWRRKGSKSRGFKYFDHAGRQIRDEDSLERIQLACHPAGLEICPDLAVGRQPLFRPSAVDTTGRIQYLYHQQIC